MKQINKNLELELIPFVEIAKKAKNVKDFIKEAKKIRVSNEVSEYFRGKYSKSPFWTIEQTSNNFIELNKH
jgi:hypothetical protein